MTSIISALTLLGLTLPTLASAETLEALYDAAKSSGQTEVVVYTPYGNHQPLWDAFTAAYPEIKPNVVVITGAPLFSRLEAERATKAHAGDLLLSNLSTVTVLQRDGYLAQDVPETVAQMPERYVDPQGYFQVPFLNLFTLVYNAKLVPEADLPKTLDELFDDKWKGKVTFGQLRGTGATDFNLATLLHNDALSDEQLTKIHANAVPAESNAAALQNVAQGRALFNHWAPTQSTVPLIEDGASLAIHALEDSSGLWGPGLALLAEAPHPEAAKLLKAWLYTPEAQALFASETDSYAVLPGVDKPASLPSVDFYAFKDIPAADVEEVLKDYRQKAGALWGF